MVTRKTFVLQMLGGTWMLALGGCGGGGSDSAPAPSPQAAGSGCAATTITDNHGHALAIPGADLDSTVAMTYSIQGAADHRHDVTFTPAQLAALKAGQAVSVDSTVTLSHQHNVTEHCA